MHDLMESIMPLMKNPLHKICWLLFLQQCYGIATAEMLPFTIPWNLDNNSISNVSSVFEPTHSSTARIIVSDDGHYASDGNRIRFWGVNIASSAAFPPKEKAQKIANRMAYFGINAVRFHHLDNTWSGSIIDYSAGNSLTLNEQNLDRLDFFIAALKSKGIYSNINLLCSRNFKGTDGLHPDVESMDWKASHALGFFDEGARNLQKQFAIDLLTHVNPYTGLSYSKDPAIAFVEINNENGLIHAWHSRYLDSLPTHYEQVLSKQWNQWLVSKYGNTETLLNYWETIDEPIGASLVTDVIAEGWNLEVHGEALASLDVQNSTATLRVTQTDEAAWHVQFNYPGLEVASNQIYTLRFSMRASDARNANISLMQAHDPWQNLGFNASLSLSTEWQDFEFTITGIDSDVNARLNFGELGSQTGEIQIRNLTFSTGGKLGLLPEGISLENQNLPILLSDEGSLIKKRTDWIRFLYETEATYWSDMKTFVKNIGYEGIIWGTTTMNSTPHLQSEMDANDSHAYWKHVQFPGNDWDPIDWFVENESMVNDLNGGVIPNLAWQRVAGKPHNVTEYQHCSPNQFTSEASLFLSTYASLQDWDGLYLFHYGSESDDWDRGYFNGFFDMDQHPAHLVNAAIGAVVFRRFDIQPAEKVLNIPYSTDTDFNLAASKGSAWNVGDARHLDLSNRIPLLHRVQMQLLVGENAATEFDSSEWIELPDSENIPIVSDTGQINWDHTLPQRSVVSVDTDRFKAVWGFQSGKIWAWPGLHMQFYNTQKDWCTASVILLDGESFQNLSEGGSGLIVTTGNTENTNMGWTSPEKISVGNQWGTTPTLVENISGFVMFEVPPSQLKVWSLDENGNRLQALPVATHELGAKVTLGGKFGSLWYEFQIDAH